MNIFFFIIIVIHGLIHILGFIKAFQPAKAIQLSRNISPPVGMLWLTTALLFQASGILYLLDKDYWWIFGSAAILLSQILIFTSWRDAKYGTIANILLLLPLSMSLAGNLPTSFHATFQSEVGKGLEHRVEPMILTETDLAPLPEPVRKYLRYAGAVGRPKVWNFHAKFTGSIKTKQNGGWLAFSSEQYNFIDHPARFFLIRSRMFGIPFDGLHIYSRATATMQIRVGSLVKVVDAKGPKMNQSETVTLFNDMCIMAPATLIGKRIQWETLDSQRVRGTFTNEGITISAVLNFNTQGELMEFTSHDRFESEDGITYRNYVWSTPVNRYKIIDGRKIASYGEAVWHTTDGDFVYGKFDLQGIEYNCIERR